MTPARTNNKSGSFIIDRVFANVGLIRRALNTEDIREWRRRVSLIERIHKQEHYGLLRGAAGGPPVTIHDLRHIHGQLAIDAGVPESKVQASFRHKSAGMTRDYVMQRDTGIVSAAIADLVTAKPTRRRA